MKSRRAYCFYDICHKADFPFFDLLKMKDAILIFMTSHLSPVLPVKGALVCLACDKKNFSFWCRKSWAPQLRPRNMPMPERYRLFGKSKRYREYEDQSMNSKKIIECSRKCATDDRCIGMDNLLQDFSNSICLPLNFTTFSDSILIVLHIFLLTTT
jgi:hypothetical protein